MLPFERPVLQADGEETEPVKYRYLGLHSTSSPAARRSKAFHFVASHTTSLIRMMADEEVTAVCMLDRIGAHAKAIHREAVKN